MKNLIILILIISLITLTLVGCSDDGSFTVYSNSTAYIYSLDSLIVNLRSETCFFDMSDVTLDMDLGVFNREEGKTIEQLKAEYEAIIDNYYGFDVVDSFFVIYVTKGIHVKWSENATNPTHKNTANAVSLKTFTLDEIFENDYSYTSSAGYGEKGKITYNKTIKLTIPEEVFDSEEKIFTVTLYRFDVYFDNGEYREFATACKPRMDIRYIIHDKSTVELIDSRL